MYELPIAVNINGIEYPIRKRGDYRMVLDVFSVLEDSSITHSERILCALSLFYEDFDCFDDLLKITDLEGLVKEMYSFFNADKPENSGVNRKLLDWNSDSALVVSAINSVANKEIRSEEYIHWWTFTSWYMAIGESVLSTVVSIREKILKGTKLEKWETQYKQENYQYFIWNHQTVEEREAEEWVRQQWNGG